MKSLLFSLHLLWMSRVVFGQADIRADTNRDGIVDTSGESDLEGKNEWTASRGAIFLANIGDTDRRCSRLLDETSSNEEHAACNDASDDIQRAPQYMTSLRTMPIPDLSSNALGSISVTESIARPLVRIFHREGGNWVITRDNTTFTSEEIANGLELGVDARDTRRPSGWDGRATIRFSVNNDGESSTDTVMLRVAPVLAHHHAQRAQMVISTMPQPGFDSDGRFSDGLAAAVAEAGIEEPVFEFNTTDVWAQDFFEPGYMSMPGPDGPVTLRTIIRSPQDSREAGQLVFRDFRDTGIGAVQFLGSPDTSIDSTGNFETIPPYSHGNRSFPAGRNILGESRQTNEFPYITSYLAAQEIQDPVILDTEWLAVGHVDEFVQFLPVDSERGWVIMASDPVAGIQLLQDAAAAGYGSMPAFSRQSDSETNVPELTIDEMLNEELLIEANQVYAERISANLDILREETGITDEEIHFVPAIYQRIPFLDPALNGTDNSGDVSGTALSEGAGNASGFNGNGRQNQIIRSGHRYPLNIMTRAGSFGANEGFLTRRQESEETGVTRGLAYYPGMINGVVLSDTQYLSPKPWGPIIDGEDIYEQAARQAYGAVGFNVTFLDAWIYHQGGGEIHCATNTLREMDEPWW